MKITRIETIPLAIPHEHGGPPPAWGGQAWEGLSILLVRVETEDGATGWGEAFSYNCLPAVQAVVDATVAPILIGRDATAIASLNRELQQALHLFGRYGITMFGISAIDIALWDLAGKRAGLPLGQLLGGPATPPLVPGYASLLKYRDRELVAETVRAALDEGYPAIKLHETGEAEIAAAREAMGADMPLCTDTNCPWTPAEAHAMAARLKPYDLYWLEEPIFPPEDFSALARLQQESGIDLACGENACTAFEFRRLLDAGAVRYVQPSVTKVGGVTEFHQGAGAGRRTRRDGDAALALLRPRLARNPAAARGVAAHRRARRRLGRALLHAARGNALPGIRLPDRGRPLSHPHRPRPRCRAGSGRHSRLSSARIGTGTDLSRPARRAGARRPESAGR